MRNLTQYTLMTTLGFFLCSPVTAQNGDPKLTPVLDQLTERLELERQKQSLPGLSVAIVRDGGVIYRQGFGFADLSAKTAMPSNARMPIGSITKVFVATLLMQFVERGLVRLDDPVVKYVPEYQVRSPYPATQPTTLRQLASHTSGLPRDAGVNFWMNETIGGWVFSGGKVALKWYVPAEELLRSLPTVELETLPNSGFRYSNLGMALLAIALERAGGHPFEQLIEENIFRPLGMRDSGFINDDNQSQFPVGYVYVPGSTRPLVAPKWQLGMAKYTGGIFSTAEDLTRFLSLQFCDGPVGGAQILSGDSLRAMRVGTGNYSACIGWWGNEAAGHQVINHNGGHFGFLSTVSAMPDLKLGVVVLANRCNPMFDLQTHGLARVIYDILVPHLVEKTTAPFDPAKVNLASYAGAYAVAGRYAEIRVEFENDRLWQTLVGSGEPRKRLFPIGLDQFGSSPDGPPALSFQSDRGKVTSLDFALFQFRKIELEQQPFAK